MEYLVIIVAALAIVVIYLCRKVGFLFRKVTEMGVIVNDHYDRELAILRDLKDVLEREDG